MLLVLAAVVLLSEHELDSSALVVLPPCSPSPVRVGSGIRNVDVTVVLDRVTVVSLHVVPGESICSVEVGVEEVPRLLLVLVLTLSPLPLLVVLVLLERGKGSDSEQLVIGGGVNDSVHVVELK